MPNKARRLASRDNMALQVGIVGLPNVGKSTLFKALTKKQVDIANYPFCTVSPNVGVVKVPDARLEKLARVSASAKILPTTIEFVDIAGLVKGAHKGEGLGNKFLANIRECDAIAHVVRSFTDKDIIHVSGAVNPVSDIETINLELIMADLATVEKRLEGVRAKARGNDKEGMMQLAALEKIRTALLKGDRAYTVALADEEAPFVKTLQLLTAKPMIYVMNVDELSIAQDTGLPHADPHAMNLPDAVIISAKLEAELAELSDEDIKKYLKDLGLKESGLDQLIRQSYKLLHLITYFTSGPEETRAWTIVAGTKAREAAGVIHSDFERGFIRAETIHWKDLVECGSESAARDRGLLRLEGKEYVVQDGDVMHFRFSV